MKKILLFLLCLVLSNNFLYAQTVDIAPDLKNQGTITPNSNQAVESCTPQFVFDFANVNPSSPDGYAGIYYVNNEFLVSKWAFDVLLRISNTGVLLETITSPISGVRSITWDGTHYWFANNTTTLYRFNLTTRTVVSTITVPIQSRYATYDSRGSGGFWIGNWNTDILKVDMSGNTVATIPAATHGLTTTYSLAFDSQTAGGPYLHSFNQDGTNDCILKTLRLSDNVFTNTIDIYSLVSPGTTLTSGLAGGLFFGSRNSENIIGGLIQGTPNSVIFGIPTSCLATPCSQIATATETMTWNGSVSTDWTNPCNWTPSGVPTATNIVVVPSAPSNQPSVSINTAVAYAVEVQTGATFTIANTGQLTVNGFKLNEGSNSAIFNKGTIQNNGKLIIGNTAASGGFIGLHNMWNFNNNTGSEITIDRVGLQNDQTFNNAGKITIGSLTSPGGTGIANSNTFNNNVGGEIIINRTTIQSLVNNLSFTNRGKITIGSEANFGATGLSNNGTFLNQSGAEISIDRSTSTAIANNAGTFTNAGLVTIGALANVGTYGINNSATFNNNACGKVLVLRGTLQNLATYSYLNIGLTQVSNNLTNNGTFTNNGILKYGTLTGTVTSNQGTSVIVNDTTPIFTYGGTFFGTIGIFTDATATTSAGTFTAPNTFTPSGLPTGSQTLYAKITTSGGACNYIVPFTYNNTCSVLAPSNPSASPTDICSGTIVSLTASCTASTVNWYTSLTGGSAIGTGSSFSQSPNSNTTYYATCKSGSCESSPRTLAGAVTVTTRPNSPTGLSVNTSTVCGGQSISLSATCSIGSATWYDSAVGGASIGTGSPLSHTPTSTKTYYASCKNGSCETARVSAGSVTYTSQPIQPYSQSISSNTICNGASVSLSASCVTGTVTWYNAETGGSSIGTSTELTTLSQSPTSTTTYYASCKNGSCESIRISAGTVAVSPIPNTPTSVSVNTTTVCIGGSVSLTANCTSSTVRWYNSATGGSVLGTVSPLTQNPTVNTTYYASCINLGCESSRVATSAIVIERAVGGRNTPYTNTSFVVANNLFYNKYTINRGIRADSVSVLTLAGEFGSIFGSARIKIAIYSDLNGEPNTLLASSDANSSESSPFLVDGLNKFALNSPVNLSCGTYWISYVLSSSELIAANYNNGDPVPASDTKYSPFPFGNAFPTTNNLTKSTNGYAYNVYFSGSADCQITAPTTAQNVNVCSGNSATLTATCNTGTVTWYTSATSSSGTANSPFVTPTISANTTYYVACVSSGCSSSRTQINLNVVPPPNVSISGSDNLSCATNSVTRTASGGGTYLWSNGLGTNAQVTISAAGIYTVTVTNGCTATATTSVTNDGSLPNVQITGSNNLNCAVTSVTRTASGGGTYLWSNGLGTNAQVNISSAGVYTVTVTATNGCTATATTTVSSDLTIPNAQIAGTDNLNCAVNAVTRTASGGGTYLWSNGLGTNATATITSVGIYTVTITGSNGCTTTATTTVSSDLAIPNAQVTGSDNLSCTVNTVTRTASGGGTYLWSNGLGTNAQVSISSAGVYTVTVTATNGCSATATTSVTNDGSLPNAQISGTDNLSCTVNAVTRTASGGGTYLWSNGLGTNAQVTISSAGVYTVTVIATNGCTATATTSVTNDGSLPNAQITGTDNLSCTVNAVTRTASGGGSYLWSNGLGTNAQVTISSIGVYTVTVTGINGCSATATTNVVFNNLVATATNTGPYLIGNTIQLNSSVGSSYSWTGPNSFTSTLQNPTISNAQLTDSGIYSVVISQGTCTATATTNVVVNTGIDPCALGIDLQLVKAGNPYSTLFSLTNGMNINQISNEVSILAVPVCPSLLIESLNMQIQSTTINATIIQNISPYTIFDNFGTHIYGRVFPAGTYTVTITGYSQDNLQGTILYGPVVTTFTILPNTASISTPTISKTVLCIGSNLDVNFSISGTYNSGNQFKVELSDENGNFGSNPVIGNTSGSATFISPIVIGTSNIPGTISCTIPQSVSGGTNYKIRVVSTDGVSISQVNNNAITIHPKDLILVSPTNNYSTNIGTKQASNKVTASNKISATANVNYQAGKAIVLNAGFEANAGTVFKAEIGGCNN